MSDSNGSVSMDGLIEKLFSDLNQHPVRRQTAAPQQALSKFISRMESEGCSSDTIVMASETAVELGAPDHLSLNAVLWTEKAVPAADGHFSLLGRELGEAEPKSDYAQLVVLRTAKGVEPDPFRLESIQFLIRSVPGLMSRAVPGKLWIRVSRLAIVQGLDFALVAAALQRAYQRDLAGIESVHSVFITGDRDVIQSLAPLALQAQAIAGTHRKLVLGADGDYQCAELSCADCENKNVCDEIRKIAVIRKKTSKNISFGGRVEDDS
jgi:CO dehydrogenase/acetyl-CoA synthase beta subunit